MKRLFQCAAFLATLFVTTAAFAANALVTTDLHMRTGPSTGYPIVATMPEGAVVHVAGCARGYNWCRVDWNGYRGWTAGSYLAFRSGRYRHRAFSRYGAEIGIPVVAGVVIGNAYGHHHDNHYRHNRRHHLKARTHHQRRRINHLQHQKKQLHRKLRRARHHNRKHKHHLKHVRHRQKTYCRHHPNARICKHH